MTDLRILIARAVRSRDLSSSEFREVDVDRVAALAFTDLLGSSLWKLKWADEPRAYLTALGLLSRRSKRTCRDRVMRVRLCRTALIEWLDDNCHSCGGRGNLEASGMAPVRTCQTCQGTGRRSLSELWRAGQLGLDVAAYRKWEPRFAAVERTIAEAETRAWFDVSAQLGRGRAEAIRIQQVDISARQATIARMRG